MIATAAATRTSIDELRAWRSANGAMISLYLNVPVDLAEHRGLVTRARELIRSATMDGGDVSESDLDRIAAEVTATSQDWLGHTLAIFACAELGLFEAIALPGHAGDHAAVAARPYIRPLLAALQRNPAYQVAVIDTKHAWLLGITDDQIDTIAERTGREVPSTRFAGWYGLEGYRIEQRVMELSRQHFRDTIGVLARSAGEQHPLVLGGHQTQVNHFVAMLPHPIRQRVAGSFHVDLQTATPAKVRELAAPVIADWSRADEAQLVNDVLSQPPGTAVATNLRDCLTAVRYRAVAQLLLADDRTVAGRACDDCGALAIDGRTCECADPDASCRPVPDVLDELANQALDTGSEVTAVRGAPFTAAARLRFPLP